MKYKQKKDEKILLITEVAPIVSKMLGLATSTMSLKTRKEPKRDPELLYINPEHIRYQHSKIRPVFSSCGRNLEEMYQMIVAGRMDVLSIPNIQVLVGEEEMEVGGKKWYFSLNNRRLWILKKIKKNYPELLPFGMEQTEQGEEWCGGLIGVRVRNMKKGEGDRYNCKNCALEAKFMKEGTYLGGG